MKAIEVFVNGQKLCSSGLEELGCQMANLSWSDSRREVSEAGETAGRRLSPSLTVHGIIITQDASNTPGEEHFRLDEHVQWISQSLSVGDEILLRLVEVEYDQVDPP